MTATTFDEIRLTGPQHRALAEYVAVKGWPGWSPRRDVLRRLAGLGLVTLRMELRHQGLTYRSRQRLDIAHVALTDKGRAYVEGHKARTVQAHLSVPNDARAVTNVARRALLCVGLSSRDVRVRTTRVRDPDNPARHLWSTDVTGVFARETAEGIAEALRSVLPTATVMVLPYSTCTIVRQLLCC